MKWNQNESGALRAILVGLIIIGLVVWRVSKDRSRGRRRKINLDKAFEDL